MSVGPSTYAGRWSSCDQSTCVRSTSDLSTYVPWTSDQWSSCDRSSSCDPSTYVPWTSDQWSSCDPWSSSDRSSSCDPSTYVRSTYVRSTYVRSTYGLWPSSDRSSSYDLSSSGPWCAWPCPYAQMSCALPMCDPLTCESSCDRCSFGRSSFSLPRPTPPIVLGDQPMLISLSPYLPHVLCGEPQQ